MSPSNKLTVAELTALMAVTHAATEQVEIAKGHSLPVSGASSSQWIAHIVRPNPTLRATFTMGAKEELALAQGIERADKFDLSTYLDDNIEEGPEVKACMGAVFLGHPGDLDVQASFTRMPGDVQRKILSVGGRLTWGKDPARFFAQVGRELAGLDAVVADSLQDQEPAAPKAKRPAKAKAEKLAA